MKDINSTIKKLQNLFDSQKTAVLSTLMDVQPYLSLMAFAVTDDLKQIIFMTNKNTQKYKNLKSNKKIAMLIDDRTNNISDVKDATAVTAIGEARELNEDEKNNIFIVFLKKNPHLDKFMSSSDSAVILMDIKKYIIVSEFEKITEFSP